MVTAPFGLLTKIQLIVCFGRWIGERGVVSLCSFLPPRFLSSPFDSLLFLSLERGGEINEHSRPCIPVLSRSLSPLLFQGGGENRVLPFERSFRFVYCLLGEEGCRFLSVLVIPFLFSKEEKGPFPFCFFPFLSRVFVFFSRVGSRFLCVIYIFVVAASSFPFRRLSFCFRVSGGGDAIVSFLSLSCLSPFSSRETVGRVHFLLRPFVSFRRCGLGGWVRLLFRPTFGLRRRM